LQLRVWVLADEVDRKRVLPRHVQRPRSTVTVRVVLHEEMHGPEKSVDELRLPPQVQEGRGVVVVDCAGVAAAAESLDEHEGRWAERGGLLAVPVPVPTMLLPQVAVEPHERVIPQDLSVGEGADSGEGGTAPR
jgi:hypothetical protein